MSAPVATQVACRYFLHLSIVFTLFMGGCSGGGGGGLASMAPTAVSMVISGKNLNFTWTAGTDVDHYRILVNPDGVSGFTVVPGANNIAKTVTSHSIEIAVHKINWLAAQYIVEGCDTGETSCVSSSTQTLTLTDSVAATFYAKASNTEAYDGFGISVALSGDGNTLAVGAYREDSNATGIGGNQADNSATDSGAVYLFTRSGTTWVQQAYVKASNSEADDWFGQSVALSGDGNTLAVGAYREDSSATGIGGNQADNSATLSGAVYMFSRSGTTWTQQAYVKASNTEADDNFGFSVALSSDGNTLAVGATGEASSATGIGGSQADNLAALSGAVYVFTRGGTTWTQQAYVKASNTETQDYFGRSVALSADGNTLAVGANEEDSNATGIESGQVDNSAGNSGAVYVLTRSGTTWTQQAYVKASNTEVDDRFGQSVALSGDGNTLAVVSYWEDSSATGIGGNQADNSAVFSGAVYVFTRSSATWTQQAYVKASNTEAQDYFGSSVALNGDGNTLAVGAFLEASSATGIGGDQVDNSSSAAGAVYVFTRSGATWNQQAYVKASNTGPSDYFGDSVALDDDGNTLAVGTTGEDSNATGIGGDHESDSAADSGAVYVY